ncbi:hypothetical protein CAPTEDRAFT_226776 [Capitella teleta]|uniref:Deoxyhypusine hydroxylase n=1 Tax=Capitella teleta TaxID=283909 RepID=N1PB47_CAPTE|nr:hypothetical protein CAPTEDRAFT_226776 [Capitella teleta]|eukprot:ELU18882.1 hypothetical protein CAPTEDRAFT_226776 [Capitella teleta]
MSSAAESKEIQKIGNLLLDQSRPLKERFRALFTLKNLGGDEAIACISQCFSDPSALLKHECAYCLGQMQDLKAVSILKEILEDASEDPIVRHEAGEALGALAPPDLLDLLKKYTQDPAVEVSETCQLALERVQWVHSATKEDGLSDNPYNSVDPAPPCADFSTQQLREILLDEKQTLFQRYRAMFALRNKGNIESIAALTEGMKCSSALFRHEIAFVLGQIQSEAATKQLIKNLRDTSEHPMVRHECAEALGAIASEECMNVLKEYQKDPERVVRESCDVALDMCDYEKGEEFQYADTLQHLSS